MNLIFLTLVHIENIEEHTIYHDLMRKFRDEGHGVYIVSPCERRMARGTSLFEDHGVMLLNVKTLNIQKTNVFEKGLGTLLIERQFKKAIEQFLCDVKFDLITYSTPPITFTNVVRFLKRNNPKAISFLQLKDVFPQNAVDLGLFGEKSVFNWFFRRKEIALYRVSDYIGCMSPANVEYVRKHNLFYPADRVEIAPNSIELKMEFSDGAIDNSEIYSIRQKYHLPTDIPIFVYGGNIGKPQGVDFLIQCLETNKHRKDCFFLVVGNGTEYQKLSMWYSNSCAENVRLMAKISKEDYEMLVKACDIGMIFLDHRFSIPNYPSRLLDYLKNKLPVICATDVNTDIGKIAEENGYGYWCESVKPEDFTALVDKVLASDRKVMGERGYCYLKNHYLVDNSYETIMKHL